MNVLFPHRMKQYDEFAINTWGIPSTVLMENAGRTTYRLMKEHYLPARKRLAVFCGRGNNGGDGFVIARYALRDGHDVRLFLFGSPSDLRGDAKINMDLYRSLGGEIVPLADQAPALAEATKNCDLIVDAIFGTGLSKEVEGLEMAAIEAINGSGKPVVAVDIPSGLDAARGIPLGVVVNADRTYTYGYAKFGQLVYPGAAHVGRLTVVDISLPSFAETELGVDAYLIDGPMVSRCLAERAPSAHKGSYGHAAVIAGSAGKTGAAAMSAEAALRMGSGLVTLLVPSSLNPILEAKLTEVMTYPVEDHGTGFFAEASYDAVYQFVKDKDVIVIGPGLGQEAGTQALVRRLYAELDRPFVVDADGINAFVGHTDLIRARRANAVFTPHPGELARLLGTTPKEVNNDRFDVGRAFVERHGVNLALKGARTLIFGADGRVFINPTGNAGLAKGGSGDILTGFIGGLAAQAFALTDAACAGVYLHGYIADSWLEEHTDMDLVAGDLLSGLSKTIRDLRNGTDRVYVEQSL